jgi:hypothetical protein
MLSPYDLFTMTRSSAMALVGVRTTSDLHKHSNFKVSGADCTAPSSSPP